MRSFVFICFVSFAILEVHNERSSLMKDSDFQKYVNSPAQENAMNQTNQQSNAIVNVSF